MKKITPFLWFNDQAEEAMRFYVSIFSDSRSSRSHLGRMGRRRACGSSWRARSSSG
jgi:predicted 3-demethylubiquinone-9 3-methyltransferase (glyoxalase superfamily)